MIDLITMKAIFYRDELGVDFERAEIPEEYRELAEEYREKLIETVVEKDDELMMKYLEGEEITSNEIKKTIRKAIVNVELIPVLMWFCFQNKGVQLLLDAVVDYLPSPLDVPAVTGINPATGEEESRTPSDDEPFAALAFKIMTDPYVGKLAFFRVYSGSFKFWFLCLKLHQRVQREDRPDSANAC